MTLVEYADRSELMGSLATKVAAELSALLTVKPFVTLAVPGGTTPGPFLTALSHLPLDWARVRVMLTDERFVPESSERSNTRLLRGTLLQNVASVAVLVPFYQVGDTPEDVLADITANVQACLPLDVCVLGMGGDMHTASIFPEADLLAQALEDGAVPVLPMRAPGAPEPRLTLTAPVLATSTHLHVLIQGADKKAALAYAQAATSLTQAPIRLALEAGATVHYAD